VTRQQAIEFLRDNPVGFAHLLGLTKLGDLHNRWITDMVKGKGDHTLQASRNTYKTTSVSVALALILLLLPRKRVLFMRKTDDDVKEIVKQVQKILLDPHTQYFAQCIYGVGIRLTTQSANEINTNLNTDIKGSSQLFGMGIGSSLTGKHFDFIFTDDIVNIKDRYSRAERDRTKLIYQELQNIKNRDGRIYNTGTPWHPDDAFSVMPEPERFSCYHPEIKAIISDEKLQEIRESMLPSLFSANYELKHIASEDVIFVNPQTGADPAKVEQGIAHIDAAYGGEDYTAFTIVRKEGETYFVYGRLWRQHVDDVQDKIIELRERFHCGKIMCEDNGDKGYLAKNLRRRGERVAIYHENMNKFLKITSYLKGVWKNVVFVAGTDEAYINQVCDYTEDSEHDDAPDSLASLIRVLWKRGGNTQDYVPIW